MSRIVYSTFIYLPPLSMQQLLQNFTLFEFVQRLQMAKSLQAGLQRRGNHRNQAEGKMERLSRCLIMRKMTLLVMPLMVTTLVHLRNVSSQLVSDFCRVVDAKCGSIPAVLNSGRNAAISVM